MSEHKTIDELLARIQGRAVDLRLCSHPRVVADAEDIIEAARALSAPLARVREAIVDLIAPYRALLIDDESRKWICPEIWDAMEEAAKRADIAISLLPEVTK